MRTEADDPLCIDAGLAADLLASLPWQRLVVLGDSVTAGVMDPLPGYATRSFADRLSDALAATRPDFESRNLAHPFLRIAEIRDRQLGPADPGIFAADRVHANARGHAIAFAAIVETLAEESPARIA